MRALQQLVAGTRVLVADGSSKAIEDVKVGSQVLAADPATGRAQAELHHLLTARYLGRGGYHQQQA
ncbi:hypothetical protein J5X84_28410 [Streptosporangiaceae bacterium NEAU-GS5]|nr:hypothetical protein [Streptosporangiaceae bacterium NEAU-GS5]